MCRFPKRGLQILFELCQQVQDAFFYKDEEGSAHENVHEKLHSEKSEEDPSQPLNEGGGTFYVSSLANIEIASILYPGDF